MFKRIGPNFGQYDSRECMRIYTTYYKLTTILRLEHHLLLCPESELVESAE